MGYRDTRENVYDMPSAEVKKAVCLVSGGMDSATCLHHAVRIYGADNVKALSAFYGQKSECELERAKKMCEKLGVERFEVDLSPILAFNKSYSSYVQGSDREIEDGSYAEILKAKVEAGKVAISDEYIPNRNSLLLNVVCSLGLQMFNNEKFAIVTGIHCDDAVVASGSAEAAYPDCSIKFANAENKALQEATAGLCHVYAPVANKTKVEVAKFGVDNGMDRSAFKNTWSCYKGAHEEFNYKEDGMCPTCQDKIVALVKGAGYTRGDILEQFYTIPESLEYLFND